MTLEEQFTQIRALADDWDDQGSKAYDPQYLDLLYDFVYELLRAVNGEGARVFPNREGSVDLQWMGSEYGVAASVDLLEVSVVSTPLTPKAKGRTCVFELRKPSNTCELVTYLREEIVKTRKERGCCSYCGYSSHPHCLCDQQ